MTTIATDGKTIAWDSQLTCGTQRGKSAEPKVVAVNGVIYSSAGDAQPLQCFVDWWEDGADWEKRPKGAWEMLIITVDGICVANTNDSGVCWQLAPVAIGSGSSAALCAMHLGHAPLAAVKAAEAVDVHTGPPFFTMNVADNTWDHPETLWYGRVFNWLGKLFTDVRT